MSLKKTGTSLSIRNCMQLKMMPAFLFMLVSVAMQVHAQNDVLVSVTVAPPYSTKVDYYETHPQQVIITLISRTQRTLDIQLRGSIIGENGLELRAGAQYRSPQPITLNAGETRVLNALAIRDLFDVDKVQVRGTSVADLRAGNGLPEGMYRICARAFDYNQPQVALSGDDPTGCSNMFRLTNLEPPIIIKPYYDEQIKVNTPQNMLFTWSFPAGAPPATLFTLKVVELFNKERNPNDAMMSATTPSFFEQDVTGNAFLFGPAQPTLIPGRKYAFMVIARDPFNRTVFRNGGRSEVSTFTYGNPVPAQIPTFGPMKTMMAQAPLVCSCLEPIPGGAVDNANATVGSKVKIGKFEMTLLEVTLDGGALKGRGKINFPMINSKLVPLLVDFTDLQLNSSNQAINGTVHAKVKSDVNFIPAAPAPNVSAIPFSSSDIDKLDQYFKANVDQLISNMNTAIDNAGFELPFGIDKNIGSVGTVVAVTGATFTPTQATFEAATVVNIPDGATKVALGARNVCMDNSGLCGQGTLYLSQDFNINLLNMKLKGVAAAPVTPLDSGTYVTFDKDGFKKLRIQAEYTFSPSLIVKKTDKVSPVTATLTATALTWSNWMASISMDPFYLNGNSDFGFTLIGGGTYDHSSTANPPGMPAIQDKMNISTADWNGFYLPNVSVELPAVIKKIGGGPPITAAAKNLIIDNQGVTGSLNATNVLAIGDGDMGGWYYSVDNFGVNFLNNSFVSGGMNGKVILPISGSNSGNSKGQLDYTSTLSKPAGSLEFQFVIKPKADMEVPLWNSKFNLLNTSTIMVKAGGGSDFQATATLNGSMDIVADLSPIPKINFRAMEFEELKIQTIAPYIGVKTFRAGFASPNKSLAGLPVNLEDIQPVFNGTKAGIKFSTSISLSDIPVVPEAKFTFEVLGAVAFNGKRPDWKYDKVSPTQILIKGDIGPLSIEGGVSFFDSDPTFGDGLSGKLTANFLSGFSASAQVLFGKTTFSYWYVDGRFQSPPPGLPLGGPIPISIFGFGGGAYYHMSQKALLNPKDLYNSPKQSATDLYKPDVNAAGFKATIILGVSDGSSFQMSGTFETTMNATTMTPIMMKLQIDAAMLSPLMQTDGAFIKGTGVVSYDFAHDIFDAAVGVNVSLAGVIDGHGFVHLNINGSTSEWFFKVGEPSDRVTLSVISFFNFDSYFMMGNSGIPGIPPPPQQVLSQIKGYTPVRGPGMTTGAGLAFGASLSYGPADLEFLIFYLKLGAGMGFDINLRQLTEGCEGQTGLPGINGWYAVGQMYMWAQFAAGIHVDTWFFEGRVPILEVEAAALLRAGLPKPTWFDGWLHGGYNILGGLLSGTMNFHVQVGDICKTKPDPFGGIPIISQLSPGGPDISILSDPQAAFNFPVGNEFVIPTIDEDGNEVNRTFQIDLAQFDVVEKKTGALFCSQYNNRAFSSSNDNKLATIYAADAFNTHTDYEITVTVQAYELKNNIKTPITRGGKLAVETQKLSFKTGGCPASIIETVLGSYPVARQRYFLQKESTMGYISITKNIPCLSDEDGYEILAVFSSYSGGSVTTFESPVSRAGQLVMFTIPTLPNERITKLQLVKRARPFSFAPKNSIAAPGAAKLNKLEIATNNFSYASSNRYVGEGNIVTLRQSNLSGAAVSIKRTPDIILYQYFFKTSKFNTLADKLAHSEQDATARKQSFGRLELYSADYGFEEGFDVVDVKGVSYTFALDSYRIGPPVMVSEAKPLNNWAMKQTLPNFYKKWGSVFYKTFYEEIGPRGIRSQLTPIGEVVGFEPPSRPIDFVVNTIDPPLSDKEIHSQVITNLINQSLAIIPVSSKGTFKELKK